MASERKLVWMTAALLNDLRAASGTVREAMGTALRAAQDSRMAPNATPMAGPLREVVEAKAVDRDGTYRLMYAANLGERIYVLDYFKKKSKSGTATPQADLDRIVRRLATAKEMENDYAKSGKQKGTSSRRS